MTEAMSSRARVARVVAGLKPSGIREFFDLVMSMDNLVTLGVGEPDFVTPWTIRESAMFALEHGKTSYTSNWGILELRESIADYVTRRFSVTYDPTCEILPTVGGSQGYDLILRAIIDPGDEVILHTPCYVAYEPMILLAGGVPVAVETSFDEGFRLDPRRLAARVTAKTKAILLNYPSNPTGTTFDRATLQAIADVAQEHDLILLSDEIYAELTYNGAHTSVAALPGARERTVVISGFSKAWAMTGWRIGYLAGPPDLIRAACRIHQYSMLCCPILSQLAALEALRSGGEPMREMVEKYEQRRRVIVTGLNEVGLPCHLPDGAFYAFPSIASTGLTSAQFCRKLLVEERVAIVPGSAFGAGGEGHVRCAYAASFDTIQRALEGIDRLMRRL
ncbi:MAG: aminotransferase class I/II-fold pyridoxal phosphate-dependent enzyme [Candidatus Schekmanbacteria bacterium]|nr:aminotransferase class I/II-fold pyridoxal phosphate-dependent enzyme [Candidatus Schekmanbacteria bacterium]